MARRRMYGSATSFMPIAIMTRVGIACLLQRVLQRQAVHDGREHAHVVAGGAVHAARGGGQAAEDVAATDHDGDLHPGRMHFPHLRGDEGADAGSTPYVAVAEQRLAGDLEQDAAVASGNRLAWRHR